MTQKFQSIDVIIPKIHTDFFTYKIDKNIKYSIGSYVKVPFRNQIVTGVILQNSSNNLNPERIKQVESVLEIEPVKFEFLEFIKWVSDYNLYPLGDIFKMVIPGNVENKARSNFKYILDNVTNIKLNEKREKLIEHLSEKPLAIEGLKELGFSSNYIKSIEALGLIKKTFENNFNKFDSSIFPELSPEQSEAVNIIEGKIAKKVYSTILLEGVTGSGKTEVFFSSLKNILLNTDGQILILLPEIVLATQLIERFTQRFGFKPCIWHSDIGTREKANNWHDIVSGNAKVIIGARSALFIPFLNLSLIIIDEEHESSFKQEEGVIYHARDMAIVRAVKEKIPVILSSATPSLETLYNVKLGKFSEVSLPSRFSKIALPIVKIIDMREANLGKNEFISSDLKNALINKVQLGEQVMLFLNRRGYAPLTLCKSCGHKYNCNNCSTWLVEHRYKNCLECHHCGYRITRPKICCGCEAENSLVACGPGVERIFEEMQNINPDLKIAMITKDTLSDMIHTKQLIKDIEDNKYNIIIGTQIIAKGLHFPKLTLVGIIDADIGLAGGDLRASEKNFQLLNQLAGRAGRENIRGEVFVQTYLPNNSIIQALANSDNQKFLELELEARKESLMPPFAKLVAIILSGFEENQVKDYASNLVKQAPLNASVRILGPAPAIISKIRNKYRYRILVKAKKSFDVQSYVKAWFRSVKKSSLVKIKIDVDPYNFM